MSFTKTCINILFTSFTFEAIMYIYIFKVIHYKDRERAVFFFLAEASLYWNMHTIYSLIGRVLTVSSFSDSFKAYEMTYL